MPPAPSDITAVVLAGGQGLRMGGVDKGWLACAGQPLVARVLQRIAPQVGHVLINANANIERYQALGHPVVTDLLSGHLGPLAGLHAALAAATTRYVVSVPCDAPALPSNLVAQLAAGLARDGANAVVVARTHARHQPAFALVAVALLPQLQAFLASGQRKVGAWHQAMHAHYVTFDDVDAFRNLNTPAELHAFAATALLPPA